MGNGNKGKNYENALWIRLKEVPVINNWQVPTNLCQLKQICTNQGIDLLAILKSFAPKARDGRRHLLLVGFPIPAHIGEDSHEMTWQAIELPALSCGKYTNRVFILASDLAFLRLTEQEKATARVKRAGG